MNDLRWPFLVIATFVSAGILVIEGLLSGPWGIALGWFGGANAKTPGFAIQYMALLDATLFFTLLLICLGIAWGAPFQAKVQGIATIIFSLVIIIAGIPMIFIALAKLLAMVALLLAIPFGTLVYLAKYADFARGDAGATLAMLLFLKMAVGVLLLLAHQLFIKNVGLVVQLAVCMVGGLVISFLHNFVPGILVSITDAIAAIVVVIIAIIWAIVLLIGGIIALIQLVRSLKPN